MTALSTRFVGQRVARKEDARFLTGRGQYVDDMFAPGHAARRVRPQRRRARDHHVGRHQRGRDAAGVVAVYTAST